MCESVTDFVQYSPRKGFTGHRNLRPIKRADQQWGLHNQTEIGGSQTTN